MTKMLTEPSFKTELHQKVYKSNMPNTQMSNIIVNMLQNFDKFKV